MRAASSIHFRIKGERTPAQNVASRTDGSQRGCRDESQVRLLETHASLQLEEESTWLINLDMHDDLGSSTEPNSPGTIKSFLPVNSPTTEKIREGHYSIPRPESSTIWYCTHLRQIFNPIPFVISESSSGVLRKKSSMFYFPWSATAVTDLTARRSLATDWVMKNTSRDGTSETGHPSTLSKGIRVSSNDDSYLH